jgi:hypothetical protein
MGISSPAVGIRDADAARSGTRRTGASAWRSFRRVAFEHVKVGTPVFIVGA